MTLAQRINALLEPRIASPGDGSLLMTALGSEPLSATELAYQRVEVLLAAWEEMHREKLAEQSQGKP